MTTDLDRTAYHAEWSPDGTKLLFGDKDLRLFVVDLATKKRTKIAESRLTAQGQISVPAEVRRRLGIGPGSVIEWDAEGDQIVVRRAGRYTSSEVHEEVFPYGVPERRTDGELKAGIRAHVKKRHARR